MANYKGVDTATPAIGAGTSIPTATVQRTIDNLEFIDQQRRGQKTWSWLVGSTQEDGGVPTPYTYSLSGIYEPYTEGLIDFTAGSTTTVTRNRQTSGLEFSTPPWEPMTIPLPYSIGGPCELDIYVSLIVRGAPGTTDLANRGMFVWPDYLYGSPPAPSFWNNLAQIRTDSNIGVRGVASSNNPDVIFSQQPKELLFMPIQSSFTEAIRTFKLTMRIEDVAYQRRFVEGRQAQELILLNFLSNRANAPTSVETVNRVFYRTNIEITKHWADNWGANSVTPTTQPGKAHWVVSYTPPQKPKYWHYVMQGRPRGCFRSKGVAGPVVNPFTTTTNALGFTNMVVYPQIGLQASSINTSSKILGLGNGSALDIYGLAFCNLYSVTVIEKGI